MVFGITDLMDNAVKTAASQAAAATEKAATPAGPSVWQQQQDLGQQKISNLQQQADMAQQGVGTLEQARDQGLQQAAMRSQQAIGAGRGMLGGGRGLAVLRQAAQERAAGEAGIRQQAAAGIQAQRQAAIGAQGEAIDEKAKMLQASAAQQTAITDALARAQAIFASEAKAQTFSFTDADRARTAKRINDEILANPGAMNPLAVAKVKEYVARILSGEDNAQGVIDT